MTKLALYHSKHVSIYTCGYILSLDIYLLFLNYYTNHISHPLA